jgi:hypothetical protein
MLRFGEDMRRGETIKPCNCFDYAANRCLPNDVMCKRCHPSQGIENMPSECFYRVGDNTVSRFGTTVSRAKYSEIASMRNATGLGDAVDFGLPMGSTGNSEFSNAEGAYSTAALGVPIGGFVRYPNGTPVGVSALRKLVVTNCFNKHGISIDPNTIEFTSKSLKGGIVTVAFRVGYHGIIFQVNSMIADITGMFSSIYYLDCSSDNMPFEILLYMGRPAQQRGAGRMPINYRGAVGQPVRQGGTVRNPSSPIPANTDRDTRPLGLGGTVFNPNEPMPNYRGAIGKPVPTGATVYYPLPPFPTNTDRKGSKKKCDRACDSIGKIGVYINGFCRCATPTTLGNWEQTINNPAFGNAVGQPVLQGGTVYYPPSPMPSGDRPKPNCPWLDCGAGAEATPRCKCDKIKEKKKKSTFSNFVNNSLTPPSTELTEKRCRNICAKSDPPRNTALMYGNRCRCISPKEEADFIRTFADQTWNATGRVPSNLATKCENQVQCGAGCTLQVPHISNLWRCRCICPENKIKEIEPRKN